MRGFACDECGEGEDVRDIEDQANSSFVGPSWLLSAMLGLPIGFEVVDPLEN